MLRTLLRRLGLLLGRRTSDPTPGGPEPAELAEPASTHRALAHIVVRLPPDRVAPGTLTALDEAGGVVSGPWPAVGKADPALAAAHGNPGCDRLRRFGDTPAGAYHLLDRLPPSPDARLASRFGPHGALVLRPVGGEAAMADANGRTTLLLHGGDDPLAAPDGALRVPDAAMAEIVALLPVEPDALSGVRLEVEDGANGAGWARADAAAGSPARQTWVRRSGPQDAGRPCRVSASTPEDEWDAWLRYLNQMLLWTVLDDPPPAHDRELPGGHSEQDRAAAAATAPTDSRESSRASRSVRDSPMR